MALDPTQIAANGVLTPQALTAQNQKLQAGQLANTSAQQGLDTEKIKQASEKLDYSLQSLAQVHDQASHDAWLVNMKKNGIDTTGDPTTYDPNWQQQSLKAGVSMKDQMQIAALSAYRAQQIQLGHDRVNKGTGGWNPMTQSWDTPDAAINDPAAPAVLGGAANPPPPPNASPSQGVYPSLAAAQAAPLTTAEQARDPSQPVNSTDPTQRLDALPASAVANTPAGQDPLEAWRIANGTQPLSPATKPMDAAAIQQPTAAAPAAQVSSAPVQPNPSQPPVQKIGETQQQFSIRMRAFLAQQKTGVSQQSLDERIRHNKLMEGGENGGIPTVDPNLSGDDVLRALTPQMASYVKGLADGSFKMPTPNTRSPLAMKQTEALMALVKQYDSTAEASRQGNVSKTEMGPFAIQISSFSTSISHLDTLSKLADALQNGDVKTLNSLANTFQTQFGKAAPTEFNAAKQIVADEIIKAIVGSGGGQGDRESAQKTIDAANSPAQLKGVIDTYKKLMGGQLDGFKRQYSGATGRNDFDSKLSSEANQQLGGAQPQTFKDPNDPAFSALPPGSKFIDATTGQTMVKH